LRDGTDFEKNLGTGREDGAGEWWNIGPAYALLGVGTDFVGVVVCALTSRSGEERGADAAAFDCSGEEVLTSLGLRCLLLLLLEEEEAPSALGVLGMLLVAAANPRGGGD
jgi:hypothetical protein